MRGFFFKWKWNSYLFNSRMFPHVSFLIKLVPVQYQEHSYGPFAFVLVLHYCVTRLAKICRHFIIQWEVTPITERDWNTLVFPRITSAICVCLEFWLVRDSTDCLRPLWSARDITTLVFALLRLKAGTPSSTWSDRFQSFINLLPTWSFTCFEF